MALEISAAPFLGYAKVWSRTVSSCSVSSSWVPITDSVAGVALGETAASSPDPPQALTRLTTRKIAAILMVDRISPR